jgi:hypothetical protein
LVIVRRGSRAQIRKMRRRDKLTGPAGVTDPVQP